MRITPERNSFKTNVFEENKLPSIFTMKRKDTGIFSAITLSLILAVCGGGGGGGYTAPATPATPTPDAGGGDSGGDSGTDTTINLDGGSYAATSGADVFSFDVSFDGTSVVGLDSDVTITGFDAASDSIVLRGTGADSSFTSSSLLTSSGVDVTPSTIDNNTVIYFSPNSAGSSSSITIEGIVDGDLSSITMSAQEGSANDSSSASTGGIDLSSGTATATSSADAFVYEIKFVDGAPVAIDGEVIIDGFDAANDTLTLQASSVPSGFGKSSLLSTAGVDVTTNTIENYTLISFAPNASGSSGSIKINGLVDADLSGLTINILSGSVSSGGTDLSSGSNIELGTDNLTAQDAAENFVIDATYASSTLSASDGSLTITGFNQADDKLVVLAPSMPVGYDLSDFKLASGVDIQASTIDNNTVIYFAPDADGNSKQITLAGVVDSDLSNTSIVFTSSLTGATSSGTATSTDTAASTDASSGTDDTSTADTTADDTTADDTTADDTTADDTTADDTTTDTTATVTYNVVSIESATADTTITATDGADEFRYEFADSGTSATSSEGNFIITIDSFDSANDKIVLVNVGGSNLTTAEFTALGGVEISGNSFDNQTRILFDKDSSGGSGELAINGVYDSDLTTITIEILSDTNVAASTSGDFG